jgi:CheY-like chemotaxis protein
VFPTANGEAGLELIERTHPELALVDLGLPVMSGFELARRVRDNADNATTRLVAVSGYGQDSDIQAALDAGFDEHLTKPADPARIEQLLKGQPA